MLQITDCSPPASSVHGNSPHTNTGAGCHTFLQGIFPTQGLNQHLLCLFIESRFFTTSTTWETLKQSYIKNWPPIHFFLFPYHFHSPPQRDTLMQAFENVSSNHFLFIYMYVFIYIFPFMITSLSWQRSLCNSMKLWAMLWRTTQDTLVTVMSFDKVRCTGGGNDNPLQYSCLENSMYSVKRQKDMTPQGDPLRLEGVQHAIGGRAEK